MKIHHCNQLTFNNDLVYQEATAKKSQRGNEENLPHQSDFWRNFFLLRTKEILHTEEVNPNRFFYVFFLFNLFKKICWKIVLASLFIRFNCLRQSKWIKTDFVPHSQQSFSCCVCLHYSQVYSWKFTVVHSYCIIYCSRSNVVQKKFRRLSFLNPFLCWLRPFVISTNGKEGRNKPYVTVMTALLIMNAFL